VTIQLRVNGRAAEVDVDPATPLLYVLRNDLGLNGPKFGCGLGQCGACTALADGKPIRSCVTPSRDPMSHALLVSPFRA
jgi:nicotinate dehydrogenase subunit A